MKFIGKCSVLILLTFWLLEYIRANYLHKIYIFDPVHLQGIGKEVLAENPGANSTVIIEQVHQKLKLEYGESINDLADKDWVFNNHGNAMGTMIILHASITEYLIFYGTATGTEGHTGTHFADDYFLILSGAEYAAPPHAKTPEVYKPGDSHHLPIGQNKQYAMDSDSWALELAQGWIPTMLPFGFLDTFSSTMDVWNLSKTVKISAIDMTKNLFKGKF